jgi:hypothetical protein
LLLLLLLCCCCGGCLLLHGGLHIHSWQGTAGGTTTSSHAGHACSHCLPLVLLLLLLRPLARPTQVHQRVCS